MDKQAVETQFLKHVDSLASRARQKLDEQGLTSLTKSERSDWVRFLMSLRVRLPATVLQVRDGASEELRRTLAAQPAHYEALAEGIDPPTLEEWTEQRFPGLIENFGMTFFHEMVDHPRIGEMIFRMRWWLWDFSDAKHELLLADNPCIFTDGVTAETLVIALPISSRKAFMATRGDAVESALRRVRPSVLALRLNESTVLQASTRVYARNRSSSRFIRNRIAWREARKKT